MNAPDDFGSNGIRWQLRNHEDRLKDLEAAKIDVISEKVETLTKRVGTLTGVGVGIIASVVGGMILFLVSVASGWVGG